MKIETTNLSRTSVAASRWQNTRFRFRNRSSRIESTTEPRNCHSRWSAARAAQSTSTILLVPFFNFLIILIYHRSFNTQIRRFAQFIGSIKRPIIGTYRPTANTVPIMSRPLTQRTVFRRWPTIKL